MDSAVLSAPAWLRGGSRPLHIAVAVILGAVAGATAGWNLSFALLVTLALLHHGPLVTTIVAGAVACAAVHVGSNLTTAVGSFCCEKIGLGGLIESLGHGPLIALLGWHDYELIGGAMLALILSLPAAHAMARRRGATNEDEAESTAAPLFRPWGCTAAVVWCFAAAATLHVAAPQRVGLAFLRQLSAATGAPVTADRMQYDLLAGRLELYGVRVRDLDEPGRVALRIDTVSAQVEPGLLLRGRLHADVIELAGLTYDADPHTSAPPKLFRAEQPTALREAAAAAEPRSSDPTQPLEAASFVRNWNELTTRLSALGRLISAIECTADLEISHVAAAQRLQTARRPSLEPRDAISGRTLPLVQIKKLQIDGLPAAWSLGEAARVELVNLTSRPATTPRGVQLTLEAPSRHTQLMIDFHLSGAERRHDATLTCDTCPAGDLVDLRHAAEVGIETTATPTLALRGRGSVSHDRLELALACDVVGFRPMTTAARFGNLDAAVWRAGVDRLGGLRLDATLDGRWGQPHLQITPVAVVDQLKHQLRSVGEHGLVKAVEAGRLSPPPSATPPLAGKSDTPTEKKSDVAPSSPIAAAVELAAAAKLKTPAIAGTHTTTSTTPAPSVSTPSLVTPSVAMPSVATPSLPPAPISPAAIAAPTPLVNPAVVAKPTTSNILPATAIAELRQPASVLDPSMTPGRNIGTVSGTDAFAVAVARTRPVNLPPLVASQPATATPTVNATKPAAAVAGTPTTPKPAATRPTTPISTPPADGEAAVVISDDAAPRNESAARTSLVGKWFGPEKAAEPTPPPVAVIPPTVDPSTPAKPEQTASKPWFPRVRKYLDRDEDDEELITTIPESQLAESAPPTMNEGNPSRRPTMTLPEEQPVETPVPQTAKTHWYQKMFR